MYILKLSNPILNLLHVDDFIGHQYGGIFIFHDFNGLIPNVHDSNDLIMVFWIQVFFLF
jgi:hypothetical protein